MSVRSRLSLGACLAASLFACAPPAPVTVPEIEVFLGVPLPPGYRDLRAADEQGIDRLMRLRLDAPEAEAAAFAARLVPDGLAADEDTAMSTLGAGLDWWFDALPAGAVVGAVIVEGRRSHNVLVAPAGPGRRRVWVAVFTL